MAQTILYLTPEVTPDTDLAVRYNISWRKQLIKDLGLNVIHTSFPKQLITTEWIPLVHSLFHATHVIIRIDGSGKGDYLTLLKLLHPSSKIIWEVHGTPEENIKYKGDIPKKYYVLTFRRKILSMLVTTCMYVTKELADFIRPRIYSKHHVVVPNFISLRSSEYNNNFPVMPTFLKRKITKKFVILWGGSARYPWQAIDSMVHVAKYFIQKDPTILFIIVGRHSWFPIPQIKNILYIQKLPRSSYIALLCRANICLALYHRPPHAPLYFFPMKLLDYMYHKRPVIASDFPAFRTIISNNNNGILVFNNIRQIVQAILRLKKDSALRHHIGRAAYKTVVTRYTDDIVKNKYRDLLV